MSAKTRKQSGGGRKTAEKPRILYFDIMRALAPILVVTLHTVFRLADGTDFFGTRFRNSLAVHMICQVAVPLFVMISGALFLNPNRKFDLKTHLRKYVLRLAIIYIVWSTIYAVLGLIVTGNTGHFFSELFGVHHYHLWFIIMLLMMYLLVPCLRKITESRALTEYFLIIGIVFCFALPSLGDSFGLLRAQHPGANALINGALYGAKDLFIYTAGKLGLKFVIYFVLGYYLHQYKIGLAWRRIVYILGALGLLYAFVYGLQYARVFHMEGNGADMQNINIGILAYSAAVYLFIKQRFSRAKKLPRSLTFMAKHSLGVYLIHAALVDFILYRIIEAESQPVWILLLCSILIYLTSLVAAWAISKLPILRKVVQ